MRFRSAAVLALSLWATVLPAAEPPAFLTWDSTFETTREDELRWPVAIAASPTEAAVADAHDARLVFFRVDAGTFRSRGHLKLAAPPVAVAYDGGRFVVALRGRGLVSVDGPDAVPKTLPLPDGAVPTLLAAEKDGLLVFDAAGERILRLSSSGKTLSSWAVEGPVTALLAADGGVLAAFAADGVLRRYTSGMADERSEWPLAGVGPRPPWPVALATWDDRVVVVDRHGSRLLLLDATGRPVGQGGRRGWDKGELLRPAGVAVLGDGRLAVVDQGNARVQVFSRLEGR